MGFWKVFAILALTSAALAAENAAVRKVIEIKYADLSTISLVLRVFLSGSPGGNYNVDNASRMVVINMPEELAKIVEDTIKRLDVPAAAPKDLELTAWFLTASDKESAWGTPPPPELEKVVTQLRNTFAFKNYRVVESLVLRTRTGQPAEATGTIMAQGSSNYNPKTLSLFKIRSSSLAAGEKGPIVRIDNLHAGLRVPSVARDGSFNYLDAGINGTDVDVAENQKVVVGKSTVEGPDHMQALIVVLSVKIL